jgi:RND family efflux transporter MFP subunit
MNAEYDCSRPGHVPARACGRWPVVRLLLFVLAIAGCDAPQERSAPAVDADRPKPVRVAEVGVAPATRELRLPGVLRATRRAEPAFLQPGYLAERLVARGERVAAGQRLATLQNPALGPALAATEARVRELDERLVQLDADYQRARELNERGLAAVDLLDRTLAERNATREARKQALAAVAEARDKLADAVLRAPFDSTVSDLLVEPGDFVAAGQPVLVLAGEDGLEVEVMLPEGAARRLAPGAMVDIRAATAYALHAAGTIREIGQARAGRPAPAIAELTATDGWEPGISVHVTLMLPGEASLTVPLNAVVAPGTGQARVFRVVDGRAVRVPVTPGRLVDARVEIGGALTAGDLVVIAGHQQLLDGDPVRILP